MGGLVRRYCIQPVMPGIVNDLAATALEPVLARSSSLLKMGTGSESMGLEPDVCACREVPIPLFQRTARGIPWRRRSKGSHYGRHLGG